MRINICKNVLNYFTIHTSYKSSQKPAEDSVTTAGDEGWVAACKPSRCLGPATQGSPSWLGMFDMGSRLEGARTVSEHTGTPTRASPPPQGDVQTRFNRGQTETGTEVCDVGSLPCPLPRSRTPEQQGHRPRRARGALPTEPVEGAIRSRVTAPRPVKPADKSLGLLCFQEGSSTTRTSNLKDISPV